MKEILLIKYTDLLRPANEEEAEKLKSFKLGSTIRCEVSTMRNGKFFRKWWSLAKLAYDYWVETAKMPEYKEQEVEPNFEKFRKDLIILAGYWHPVTTITLTPRPEADSISYASMDEVEFEKFYSKTIDAVLKYIYKSGMTEERLRETVEEIMRFDS